MVSKVVSFFFFFKCPVQFMALKASSNQLQPTVSVLPSEIYKPELLLLFFGFVAY